MIEESSVKNSKITNGPTLSTQTYLRISEIRDNTLVLKNGGLRTVLRVSSINFNLKSEDEQNAIVLSYQGFLNTIEDPIQIVVRSSKLDIDHYLDTLKEKAAKQENALLKKQTTEYIDYIGKLVEYTDIMSKEFYVIVPEEPYRSKNISFLGKFMSFINAKDSYSQIRQRRLEFSELKKKLAQKVNSVTIGLENCGLKTEELSTKELIKLFYEIYNPSVSRLEKGDIFGETDLQSEEEILERDKIIEAENKHITSASKNQKQSQEE